jgi:outer membrane protein
MKKIFIVALGLMIAFPIYAQKKLTLKESISIALRQNTTLRKSENNIRSSKASVKSSFGGFLPSLSASGSWNWNKVKDLGGQQIDYFGTLVQTPSSEQDNRNYSVSVGGGWTLFDGLANISNFAKSKNQLQAARFNLIKLKQDIVLQTETLFYNVVKAKYVVAVRKDNLEYNKKFLEQVEERYKLGAAQIADVYGQKVQTGNAELNLIRAKNDLDNARTQLLDYLSLNVLDDYEVVSSGTDSAVADIANDNSLDVEQLVDDALAARPDYIAQQFNLKAAENQVTSAKSGFFPTLSGHYSFSSSAAQVNNLFNRDVYSAGLALSIPIFSKFSTSAQIEYAKVGELNAIEETNAFKRKIKMEIKQAYTDLIAAKKGLEVSKKTVEAAEENRKINHQKYELGSATIVEVLKSDTDYQDALRALIDAKYAFLIQKARLLNSLGKLDYKVYEKTVGSN